MSRIRSRQLESESVPTRVLKKDAATSDKIGTYAVRSGKEHWPGSRKVRAGDLSAGAVTVIEEKAADAGRPATILLEASSVAVASGSTDPVEFTVTVRQQFVDWESGAEVVWPFSGTVVVWVAGEWDNYDGGGVVEVLLDGVVVWPSDWLADASTPSGVIASIWNAGSVAVGERLVQDGSSPPEDLTLEDGSDYLYEDV